MSCGSRNPGDSMAMWRPNDRWTAKVFIATFIFPFILLYDRDYSDTESHAMGNDWKEQLVKAGPHC